MSKGIGITELTSVLTANPRMVGAIRGMEAAGFLSVTELEALLADSVEAAEVPAALSNAKLATPGSRTIIAIPIDKLTNLTAGGEDVATDIVPGFAGTVEAIFYIGGTLATSAGAATMALHVEIGTTPVTGGVLTLDEASIVTPAVLGVYVAGTPITALNVFTNVETLSLVNAAGGTVFTAGAGVVILVLSVEGQ